MEHALQERQLHFERVLLGMRECVAVDVRQSLECRQCGRVERHLAQRRREPVSARCRQASHGDAMGRTDQYDAGNVIRVRCEASVGGCCDRTRVRVPRVRHDQGLGRECEATRRRVEQSIDLGAQCLRIGRIEHSRHGRGPRSGRCEMDHGGLPGCRTSPSKMRPGDSDSTAASQAFERLRRLCRRLRAGVRARRCVVRVRRACCVLAPAPWPGCRTPRA